MTVGELSDWLEKNGKYKDRLNYLEKHIITLYCETEFDNRCD